MNWTEVAVIGLINLGTALFVYGRLTERVHGQGQKIVAIEKEQVRQWDKLDNHESRISRIEGQRPNGAAH